MDQEVLNKYFGENWKPNLSKFKFSGWEVVNRVKHNETVLDVGCGFNLHKEHFGDRLYGIDPANDAADEKVSIEDFDAKGRKWDVAFCLGSINFGTDENIIPQIKKVVSLIKPKGIIIWRQNPGLGDHPWKGVEEIKFYPWTIQKNWELAEKFNCTITEIAWDSGDRIFAVWQKK